VVITKLNKLTIASVACLAIFAGFSAPAFADTSSVIDKLYELGVLNDEDYAELSKEAKEERREAAAEAAKDNDPNKISCGYKDGYKCKSKDGQFGFQIAGRIQQDYRDYDSTSTGTDAMDIRRLYFGIKGHVYGDWKYELTKNFDDDAVEYAFIEYAGNKNAHVRIGSQKFSYSFEEITSSRFTDFVERSLINKMVIGKDRGVSVFGEPIKNQFAYAVGYFNGNAKDDDDNNGKGKVVRLAYNMTGDAGKKSGKVVHFDIARAIVNNPAGNAKDVSNEMKNSTKGWDTTQPTVDSKDTFTNVGMSAMWDNIKLQAERNEYNIEYGSTNGAINTDYIALNYLITGERYADNYSLGGMKAIKPNSPFGNGGMGAWEIGVRKSTFDVDAALGGSGTRSGGSSTTYGIKWIPNHKVRFILNAISTDYGTTQEDAYILRTQLDF